MKQLVVLTLCFSMMLASSAVFAQETIETSPIDSSIVVADNGDTIPVVPDVVPIVADDIIINADEIVVIPTDTVDIEIAQTVAAETDLIAQFVTRLYEALQGRAPDAEGLAYWATALTDTSTMTAAGVVDFFIGSDEYQSKATTNEAYVTALYSVVFERAPDDGGLAWHLQQLEQGVSRTFTLASFANSAEFIAMCQNYGIASHKIGTITTTEPRDQNPDITAFVARMYTKVMGRSFDADGVNYWVAQLLDGSIAGKQVAASFVFGDEYLGKNASDADYVSMLYAALMGRTSDAEGTAYWCSLLASGSSRQRIFNQFANSAEFLDLMQQYGVSTGGPDVDDPATPTTPVTPPTSHTTLTVKTQTGAIYTDTVENVLCGIVAAEVGGFQNVETYKAQAIAAHSWLLYQYAQGNAAPSVAITDATPFEAYGLRTAVREVQSQVLTYNGSVAFTPYFASSAPYTNANEDVWGTAIPYLTSVESKYDGFGNTGNIVKRTFTSDELYKIANDIYGGKHNVAFTGTCDTWFTVVDQQANNHLVKKFQFNMTWTQDSTGTQKYNPTPRGNFVIESANKSLGWYAFRSPNFTMAYNGDNTWSFTFYGWGHGVGMSQWGAYGYATQENWTHKQILAHYFSGTTLQNV